VTGGFLLENNVISATVPQTLRTTTLAGKCACLSVMAGPRAGHLRFDGLGVDGRLRGLP
jgi:hypothetical protein